jgi:hypothetical protein
LMLEDMLQEGIPNLMSIADLGTQKRQANYQSMVSLINRNRHKHPFAKLVTIDIDRKAEGGHAGIVGYDRCITLRKNGPKILVMTLDGNDNQVENKMIFRYMTDIERFRLQGHCDFEASCSTSNRLLWHATGNAYNTCMLERVVTPIFKQISSRNGWDRERLTLEQLEDIGRTHAAFAQAGAGKRRRA